MSSLKDVVFKLRDIEPAMVSAWKEAFHSIRFDCNIEVSFLNLVRKKSGVFVSINLTLYLK